MIDKTLSFLLAELNAYLNAGFPAAEPHAVIGPLAMHDGSPPEEIDNKIVITVANIERETTAYSPQVNQTSQSGLRTVVATPFNLNVYLLVSGNFRKNYAEALRLLSSALIFFHSKSVFTPQNSVGFPSGMERLTLEMVNLNMVDLQNLWACQGAKYLPSGFYKARMLSIQEQRITDREPVITGTDASV